VIDQKKQQAESCFFDQSQTIYTVLRFKYKCCNCSNIKSQSSVQTI